MELLSGGEVLKLKKTLTWIKYLCSAYMVGFGLVLLTSEIQTSSQYAGWTTLLFGLVMGLWTLKDNLGERR